MRKYSVGFPSESIEKHFLKELSRLDKPRLSRIKQALDSLANNPRPEGKKIKSLRPPLAIYSLIAAHRLRVGDYRVLYDIDDTAKKVVLLAIRRKSEKTYR